MFSRLFSRAAAAAATAIGASLTNVCVAEDSKAFKMGIYAPPGGGKGTVCKKLVEEYGLVQVSTGDLLRDIAKGNTDLGKKLKGIMKAGDLVPADIIHQIIGDYLKSPEVSQKGFILDGVCRTRANAEYIRDQGLTPDLNLILDVTEAEVQDRLGGRVIDPVTKDSYHLKYVPPPTEEIRARCIRRSDDKPDAIKRRFNKFHEKLNEVLAVFPDDTIKKVNGMGKPTDVYVRVQDQVDKTKVNLKIESLYTQGAKPKRLLSALNSLSFFLTTK